MDALYNRHGQVAAWLDRVECQIVDLSGKHVAFVDGDSVYDYSGSHVGWWRKDHIRDSRGAVGLYTSSSANLGVTKPYLAYAPFPPLKAFAPFKPFKAFKPFRPYDQWSWSSDSRWS